MATPTGRTTRSLLLFAAVGLTTLGAFTLLTWPPGYVDAQFETDFTIRRITQEGPMGLAGFRVGDSVVAAEGVPVTELGMYSRWPKSFHREPGQTLTLTAIRGEMEVTADVVSAQAPPAMKAFHLGLFLVAMGFLWAGVWSFLAVESSHASSLVVMGLAAGLALPTPKLNAANGLLEHVHMSAMALWTLMILYFFLTFPRAKRVAETRVARPLIFGPLVILLGCQAMELLFHPRFYYTFNGYVGALTFLPLLFSMAALVHSWVKTPRGELGPSGLGWVLTGFGLGIGGVLIWAGDALLLRDFDLPGSNWAPLLFAVVPVTMALGVRRMEAVATASSGRPGQA